jgi:microcystin degradation protein MlrC
VAHVHIPILIPGEKGITAVEPLKSLYEQLPDIAMQEGLLDASIFVGMPWTDVPHAGMSIQVVAQDKSYLTTAQDELRRLATQLWDERQRLQFDVPTDNIRGAVETALKSEESTVFITDSGDNTTAGAAGDNTLVLEYLISHGVQNAIVAGIVDPEAVRYCDGVGVGNEVSITIGGKIDTVFGQSLEIRGIVKMVSSYDSLTRRKPAVVRLDGIDLVLLTDRRSFYLLQDFKEVGLDPLNYKIVVVKLGYLFQGLRDISPMTIMALTPGFANQLIEGLPYQNVNRPIYPLDEDMQWDFATIY